MGLLDLFKSHANDVSPQPAGPADASAYAHMRVEVTTLDGRLLFVAKLMNPRGTTAELHRDADFPLPRNMEPIRAHIRGYHDDSKKAVYMEGVITPVTQSVWKVERLMIDHAGNDRSFFRLDMNIDASVTKFGGQNSGERPCKLLNISVGGARIASMQRYWEGDRLLLHARLSDERDNSAIFCKVLRVIDKGSTYEYGCQFLELTEADEGKITQKIFALQRKMRSGSR